MKFCPSCGRPLQDNEVCTCQAQRPQQPAAQAPYQSYQQPAAPQRQYGAPQQQYGAPQQYGAQPQQIPGAGQQGYYQQPPKKASNDKFSKALKNIPVVLKDYWTGSDKLESAAKKSKDWIIPLVFIWVLFFVNLIFGICYFARMTDSTGNYQTSLGIFRYTFYADAPFKFGFVLLGALIAVVAAVLLYVCFRTVAGIVLAKKKPVEALLDSVIEFGLHSLPMCAWLILGSLLSLATAWLSVPFMATAMAYYVVIGVSNTVKESDAFKNTFARNAILAGFVMLGVGLMTWVFFLICRMNTVMNIWG